jgi:hypothetical protein
MLVGFSLVAVFTIALVLIRTVTKSSDLEAALARARETGEVAPLADVIAEMPDDRQPTEWNQALDDLWQSYHREEAAQLVVEAARRSDATILQYWMQQVVQVEPRIADAVFTDNFLETHFDPEVASRCGSSGCCG